MQEKIVHIWMVLREHRVQQQPIRGKYILIIRCICNIWKSIFCCVQICIIVRILKQRIIFDLWTVKKLFCQQVIPVGRKVFVRVMRARFNG